MKVKSMQLGAIYGENGELVAINRELMGERNPLLEAATMVTSTWKAPTYTIKDQGVKLGKLEEAIEQLYNVVVDERIKNLGKLKYVPDEVKVVTVADELHKVARAANVFLQNLNKGCVSVTLKPFVVAMEKALVELEAAEVRLEDKLRQTQDEELKDLQP